MGGGGEKAGGLPLGRGGEGGRVKGGHWLRAAATTTTTPNTTQHRQTSRDEPRGESWLPMLRRRSRSLTGSRGSSNNSRSRPRGEHLGATRAGASPSRLHHCCSRQRSMYASVACSALSLDLLSLLRNHAGCTPVYPLPLFACLSPAKEREVKRDRAREKGCLPWHTRKNARA